MTIYIKLSRLDGSESNIDLKHAKMDKAVKKVKYARFERSTMLHTPLLHVWYFSLFSNSVCRESAILGSI
jgi:hypothetical protein